jgi:hypothetical protein
VKRVIGWEGLASEVASVEGAPGSVLTLGVFDGLHRGHMRLLAAAERLARAAGLQRVHIGFTPHPDLLMRGATPLQLLDAGELELRMAGAGVDLWCDLPFTPETRDTPWEDFIERLVGVTAAKSIVLSPESAFGPGAPRTACRYIRWPRRWLAELPFGAPAFGRPLWVGTSLERRASLLDPTPSRARSRATRYACSPARLPCHHQGSTGLALGWLDAQRGASPSWVGSPRCASTRMG